jgi:serine/threonine-protein kinase
MPDTQRCEDAQLTLAQVAAAEQPLTPARTLALVRASALALDRFHARQAVHGTLSPQLFRVDGDDHVVVRPPAAVDGPSVHAPAYWSPQRRAGQPPRTADDVYALGLIAELLLNATDTAAIADDPFIRARLAAAEALVRALTSWSPAERPASGAEVVRALDHASESHAVAHTTGLADAPAAPRLPAEPPWAAAERVSQARRAHQLALRTPPRPDRPARPPRVRAPLGKGHYPDMPLPLPWVAAIVVVLCSVYLMPIYFMLFPSG